VSSVSHLLLITASRFAEASTLSPLIYLELVGATIFGLLVFGQLPSMVTWLGMGLVVAGGLDLKGGLSNGKTTALNSPGDDGTSREAEALDALDDVVGHGLHHSSVLGHSR